MELVYTRDLKSRARLGLRVRVPPELPYQYRKRNVLDKEIRRKIRNLEKRAADLNALVDTLQSTLRRADSVIKNEKDRKYVFTHAGRWAIDAKI